MKKERWGKKYEDKRDWREYNEKLVVRGEAYISLDFIDSWKRDLEQLNRGKVGAPYKYPECLMVFLAYLHVLLNIDYRGLEGFLRGLTKLVHFDVPDYATICRRVNRLHIEVKKTLIPFKGKEVVISLDSSGVKVSNRGKWMRQKWKVRRGWIKVHISVDDQNKQVVASKPQMSLFQTRRIRELGSRWGTSRLLGARSCKRTQMVHTTPMITSKPLNPMVLPLQ